MPLVCEDEPASPLLGRSEGGCDRGQTGPSEFHGGCADQGRTQKPCCQKQNKDKEAKDVDAVETVYVWPQEQTKCRSKCCTKPAVNQVLNERKESDNGGCKGKKCCAGPAEQLSERKDGAGKNCSSQEKQVLNERKDICKGEKCCSKPAEQVLMNEKTEVDAKKCCTKTSAQVLDEIKGSDDGGCKGKKCCARPAEELSERKDSVDLCKGKKAKCDRAQREAAAPVCRAREGSGCSGSSSPAIEQVDSRAECPRSGQPQPRINMKIDIICCSFCWESGQCCRTGCCLLVCCVATIRHTSQQRNSTNQVERSSSQGEQTAVFAVTGITCGDCSKMIEDRLMKSKGVISARASAITGRTDVKYNAALLDEQAIMREIKSLGHGVQALAPSASSQALFDIDDDLGAEDARTIESYMRTRYGVLGVSVNLLEKTVSVEYEPLSVGIRTLMEDVEALGFSTRLHADVSGSIRSSLSSKEETRRLGWRFLISAVLGIPVLLISFVFPHISAVDRAFDTEVLSGLTVAVLVNWILATPIQFWVGHPLYVSAYRALRYGRSVNMDTLVVLSTSTAYFYSAISTIISMTYDNYEAESFFETSAVLLMLIMLGRYLEAAARGKTSNILVKLAKLQATTAILMRKAESGIITEEKVIDVGLVQPGDLLKVLPGSKIPTDGLIAYGSTTVDESMITGESMPIEKQTGDSVYGSTINQQGTIHVRATRVTSESTLAAIGRLVEEAQVSKPSVQRVADRIAALFVPFILLLTILIFALWISLAASGIVDADGNAVSFALRFAIAVLVISCPCAIGLAVPTAVMVGTGVAAQHGILFKSGPILETCHNVRVVVFDKTGTLTHGKPVVTEFRLLETENEDSDDILFLIGSAERSSEHVLGRAIYEFAKEQCTRPLNEPENFQATPGKGLACIVAGRNVCVGNRMWMQEQGVSIPSLDEDVAGWMESRGQTVVWAATDSRLVALIALADTPKPESAAVVHELQQKGVNVWLLSGDNPRTVEAVASGLGILHAAGGLLPEDKVEKIRELQSNGQVVAMVGDGINDSPALAQANVGIAVGAGTDIALEAADVILVKNDLKSVLIALDISRTTFRRISLNFAWAFLYNVLGIPLAAGILYPFTSFVLPPALAGLSELLSSLPVVIFSLLLHLYRVPRSVQGMP